MPTDCYAIWKAAKQEEDAIHIENMDNAVGKAARLAEIERHAEAVFALRMAYESCVNGGGDA